MNYGEIFSQAWHVTWKHKILWLFAILMGTSSTLDFRVMQNFLGGNPLISPELSQQLTDWEQRLEALPLTNWLPLLVLAGMLILLLTVLSYVARGGLYAGALQAIGGAEQLQFGELGSLGLQKAARLFAINLLFSLCILLPLGGAFAFIALFDDPSAAVCLLPLVCLATPFSIVLSICRMLANVSVVARPLGVWAAMDEGVRLARNNPGNCIAFLILSVVINLAVSLLMALPLIAVGVVVVGSSVSEANYLFATETLPFWGLTLLIAGLFSLLYQGMWGTFLAAAEVNFYQRLHTRSLLPAEKEELTVSS